MKGLTEADTCRKYVIPNIDFIKNIFCEHLNNKNRQPLRSLLFIDIQVKFT